MIRKSDGKDISEEVVDKIIEREKARESKDYGRSDEIRDELVARGITLRDTPDGAVWEYK